ncbi:hypothetical protein [Pantoea vagans]|uniref:hypothetical protein n=1 Tax=Pantoea vagans TaxID=470934 RepID=UPI00301B2B10
MLAISFLLTFPGVICKRQLRFHYYFPVTLSFSDHCFAKCLKKCRDIFKSRAKLEPSHDYLGIIFRDTVAMNKVMPDLYNVSEPVCWPLRRVMKSGTEIPFNTFNIVKRYSADKLICCPTVCISRSLRTAAGSEKLQFRVPETEGLLISPE